MNERTKLILGYVAVGLAAALIAGALVWAVMSGRAADEQTRAETAEEQAAELESEVASLTARVEALASADGSAQEDSSGQDPVSEVAEDGAGGETSSDDEDGRHFCFVREVLNETGTTMITVDYADMLTGDEAAAAASAAGAESPPPNDFFISNVNPLLRTFPVESGISVTLVSQAGGLDMDGYAVPLGQWQDFFAGMSPGMEVVQEVPYWIEIDDGVVTSIEEQFLP